MNINQLVTGAKIVQAFPPGTPSTSTADTVSLKNYARCTIILSVDNGNTVTGSAIALLQATDVAAATNKALAFSEMWANVDTGASDALVKTAVTSNTFTTTTVNAKNALYVIEVDARDLDTNGGYDCLQVTLGNAANTVIDAIYILHGSRYAQDTPPAAITD